MYGIMALPSAMAFRLPHFTLALMDLLSAQAKAPMMVMSISLSADSVLMFSFSKYTAMPSSFKVRI